MANIPPLFKKLYDSDWVLAPKVHSNYDDYDELLVWTAPEGDPAKRTLRALQSPTGKLVVVVFNKREMPVQAWLVNS